MSEFLVLLREDPAIFAKLSPTEMQQIIERYSAWFDKLAASGRLQLGKKLKDEGGVHLRSKGGAAVASDGPYAEAKDVVSGVFVFRAESYAEAQSVLADCPHYQYGWMELRAIDAMH
jgi:hypothetical protein